MKNISQDFSQYLQDNPLVVITLVHRYLGFSAPIPPTKQFGAAAESLGVSVVFKDPQRVIIETKSNKIPQLLDEYGPINGSVYFAFGHELLDRNMTKLIIMAAESSAAKVVNGSDSLTINDDKAMLAITLSNCGIKSADSWICSARAPFQAILDDHPKLKEASNLIGKTSGFTAGGVGIQPLPANIDYIAPFTWSSRSDARPKIIQNNIAAEEDNSRNKVIRTYVVGGKIVGSYFTEGAGIVNCAGLARDPKSGSFVTTSLQQKDILAATTAVGATGFCRIDSTAEKKPAIFEVNPLARIDADTHGFNVAQSILEYMLILALEKFQAISNEK